MSTMFKFPHKKPGHKKPQVSQTNIEKLFDLLKVKLSEDLC